jgi:hypothetical protein
VRGSEAYHGRLGAITTVGSEAVCSTLARDPKPMRLSFRLLLPITLLCGSVGIPQCCSAQVQLPAVDLGITNFEDGLAVPGWLFQEFPDYYDADKLKDARGNTVPGSNHFTSFSTTSHIVYVTQQRVIGGWIAFEALQPWARVQADFANGPSTTVRGLADLTVGGGLQWEPAKVGTGIFGHRLFLDVTVPTGQYKREQAVNLGNHCAVIEPYYAVTYELEKIEFSARLHYLWASVNHEPFVGLRDNTTQSGQAFHMNYATSYEVIHNIRVGFNGYWVQQLTDHEANGVRIPDSLERTVGLGGGIQLFTGHNTWIHLNGYKEVDVRNRTEGYNVVFRISKGIPSLLPQQ